MHLVPKIIDSGQHVDERGKLIFFNELNLQEVKRLYIIEHPDLDTVRAWQAHKKEQKWFFVIEGCFKVVIVQPDDWDEPSEEKGRASRMMRCRRVETRRRDVESVVHGN